MRRWVLAWSLVALGCGDAVTPDPAPAWSVVFDSLDRVALSAWGPSLDDLWVVGGALGATVTPPDALLLHRSADGWTELDAQTTETLWWAWGAGPDDVWFVGSGGAILHWDGASVRALTSPTTATLFGVWGAGPTDAWAVGGEPIGAERSATILHFDGASWSEVALDPAPASSLFKVWGAGANDVWAVGQDGLLIHFDGSTWSRVDAGITGDLFTVTGTGPTDVWAVGGPPPYLLHFDGTSWTRLDNPGLAATLNGVAAATDGTVLVAGGNGVKWRRDAAGMWFDEYDQPPFLDLHAAWLSPDGQDGIAVGGNYNAPASSARRGVIAYFGAHPPSSMRAP